MSIYQVTAKAIPAQGYNRGGHFWLRDGSTHLLSADQLKACQDDRARLAVITAVEIVDGKPVEPVQVPVKDLDAMKAIVAELELEATSNVRRARGLEARIAELEALCESKDRRIAELEQQIAKKNGGK